MNHDLLKFALMGSYTAPNGIKFVAQYFSSDQYAETNEDRRSIGRYAPYRFYDDDTIGAGFRMSMGIPF